MDQPTLLLLSFLAATVVFFLFRGSKGPVVRRTFVAGGIQTYPIIGPLLEYLRNRDRFLDWCVNVVASSPRHTMVIKIFNEGAVITADPRNVEHMLKTNFDNYPKGENITSALVELLGHGIFNSDGEQWQWQRKAAAYEFSKRSLREFLVEIVMSEVSCRLLPLLREAADDGRTLDLQDVLQRFAFDNICRMAFGKDPGCLSESADANTNFMKAFTEAQDIIASRFMSPSKWVWKMKKLLNIGSEKRLREILVTVHSYAMGMVQECKEDLSNVDDLLSRFAAAKEHSDEDLRDVITNFILAGRETTSSALTWFFWILSTRPDVEQMIRAEVAAVRKKHGTNPGEALSYDELREMQFVHAAITESMRLYPPVAIDTQSCKNDDIMPDGTFVGKGWTVSYCAYAMGRITDIWGEDCSEYKPERWLHEDGTFRPESPFRYPVFHAGPRTCLGKEMAYIQMKSIVACVMETFQINIAAGREGRPQPELVLTMRMKGGLPIKIQRRETEPSHF